MDDPDISDDIRPDNRFGRILLALANILALFGGIVLLVIVSVSFLSILGRFLFSTPLLGDFELVEMGCAMAISAFLPLCQMHNGNVIVDFITARASRRVKAALDGVSALAFGVVAGFFAWRMVYGAQDMYKYGEETMLLQAPIWIPFLPVILSFFLLSVCCFYTFYMTVSLAAGRT